MPMSDDKQRQANSNNKTAKKLLVVVAAMFGFGFALVPLYLSLIHI